MAVLVGGFKVPDLLHFCRRFKKPSFFKKPTGAKKAEKLSIYFEKAGKVLALFKKRFHSYPWWHSRMVSIGSRCIQTIRHPQS
jgi:hypothetical protein